MSFQNANAKDPLINHETPTLPWEIVGTDLFSFYGRDYVVVVDNQIYSGPSWEMPEDD